MAVVDNLTIPFPYVKEALYQRRFKMGRSDGASFQIVTGI